MSRSPGPSGGRPASEQPSANHREQLTRFVSDISPEGGPGDVVSAAKLHQLDVIGCAIAAAALDVATPARRVVATSEAAEPSTVIRDMTLPPTADAALANGALAHRLDFDDTHPGAICHISAPVAPAALPVGQELGAVGAGLVTALFAGNEVVVAIGCEAAPSYRKQGFHPTSFCGVFGAAVVAVKLRGLSTDALTNALRIAGGFASGLFAYLQDGSTTSASHPGLAAHGGVPAGALAAAGATGPAGIIEGFGLLHILASTRSRSTLFPRTTGTGRRRISHPRRTPLTTGVHACVDAVCDLQRASGFAADDVAAIHLLIPEPAVPVVLQPRQAKIAPRTGYDAKFSLQYSVAAMHVKGSVGVETHTRCAIADRAVLDVAARVTYAVHDFPTAPAGFPGSVRIQLRLSEIEQTFLHQRGVNPMPTSDVRDSFRENGSIGLRDQDLRSLEEAILDLENVADLTAALSPLSRVQAVGLG